MRLITGSSGATVNGLKIDIHPFIKKIPIEYLKGGVYMK